MRPAGYLIHSADPEKLRLLRQKSLPKKTQKKEKKFQKNKVAGRLEASVLGSGSSAALLEIGSFLLGNQFRCLHHKHASALGLADPDLYFQVSMNLTVGQAVVIFPIGREPFLFFPEVPAAEITFT